MRLPEALNPGEPPEEFLPGLLSLTLSFIDAQGATWFRHPNGVLNLTKPPSPIPTYKAIVSDRLAEPTE